MKQHVIVDLDGEYIVEIKQVIIGKSKGHEIVFEPYEEDALWFDLDKAKRLINYIKKINGHSFGLSIKEINV